MRTARKAADLFILGARVYLELGRSGLGMFRRESRDALPQAGQTREPIGTVGRPCTAS